MENELQPQSKPSTFDKLAIPIAIVIAGALVAGALYYSNSGAQNAKIPAQNTGTMTASIKPVSDDDHLIGNPSADIIIVEYSDTECPFCKQFHTTMRRIMDEYGKNGKVAWVYRHFPIEQLHSKARKEAEALECANELGGPAKFWEYTNLLYDTTPSNNGLDLSELPKMAKTVGLDSAAFSACLSSGKYAEKVESHYQDIIKAGGRGTPTSFIILKDGTTTMVPGALPYESLKSTIDTVLK